jgi:hypothetical protein
VTTSKIDAIVADLLTAAVGHGIAGGAPWPGPPLEPSAFTQALHSAREHRLTGAFAEAVFDGALKLDKTQHGLLCESHASAQAHMLELERTLLRVSELFSERGLDMRVLKGLALARVVYADPAWRVASDVDVLVPSHQFDDAVANAIHGLGGHQQIAELRPGFDREFGKEALIQLGNSELDLHRTLVTGPFGHTIDLDEFFTDSQPIMIGGRQLLTHSPDNQFLHGCYNTALGDYPVRLCAVRDLLLCDARLEIDHDAVIATAARWNGTAVVQRAAELVINTVGADAGSGFNELANLPVPRTEAWLMRSYLTPARSYSRPLASLAVISGIRPRLRYARALLTPSRTYLQSRGWTTGVHIKRAAGRLRRHA